MKYLRINFGYSMSTSRLIAFYLMLNKSFECNNLKQWNNFFKNDKYLHVTT